MKKMLEGLLLCFFLPAAFAGHHEKGEKMSHASAEWQIEAYTSAAPDFIGDFASVRDPSGKYSEKVLMVGPVNPVIQDLFPRMVGRMHTMPCQFVETRKVLNG